MIENFNYFLYSSFTGRMLEQGIANAANLATLRHGTNVLNWCSIHAVGTNPNYGGNKAGGEFNQIYKIYNIGCTFFSYAHEEDGLKPKDTKSKFGIIIPKLLPKMYEISSNVNLLLTTLKKQHSCLVLSYLCFSGCLSLIVPSVKVHFPDSVIKDLTRFQRDENELFAYFTRKPISPLNIGVIGSLWHSCNCFKTLRRMQQNPNRVLTGVVQMTIGAIALNALLQNSATTTSVVGGLVLGMM